MVSLMENRLPILIMLVLFVLCLYITEAFVLQAQADVSTYKKDFADLDENTIRNNSLPVNVSDVPSGGIDIWGSMGMFWDLLFGLGAFLTFTAITGMPVYAILFLTIIVMVCVILIAYIVLSFVYDFVKALPFT